LQSRLPTHKKINESKREDTSRRTKRIFPQKTLKNLWEPEKGSVRLRGDRVLQSSPTEEGVGAVRPLVRPPFHAIRERKKGLGGKGSKGERPL